MTPRVCGPQLTRRGVRHGVQQRRATTTAENVNQGERACWRARLWFSRNVDFGVCVDSGREKTTGGRRCRIVHRVCRATDKTTSFNGKTLPNEKHDNRYKTHGDEYNRYYFII